MIGPHNTKRIIKGSAVISPKRVFKSLETVRAMITNKKFIPTNVKRLNPKDFPKPIMH
jgi:hypothetical protein